MKQSMNRGREPWPRAAIVAGVLLAGFVAVSMFDGAVYRAVGASAESRAALDGDWTYRAFRQAGSVWTWLVVGALLVAWDVRHASRLVTRPAWLSGVYVVVSAAGAGLAAELLKLVIGRERPATMQVVEGVESLVYQGYHFRGLFSGFVDGSNLGLPSSHAAVAAGAAFALVVCRPVGLAALILAVGCGLSRIDAGAHFASDVYAGLAVGFIIAGVLGRAMGATRRSWLGGFAA